MCNHRLPLYSCVYQLACPNKGQSFPDYQLLCPMLFKNIFKHIFHSCSGCNIPEKMRLNVVAVRTDDWWLFSCFCFVCDDLMMFYFHVLVLSLVMWNFLPVRACVPPPGWAAAAVQQGWCWNLGAQASYPPCDRPFASHFTNMTYKHRNLKSLTHVSKEM